MPEQERGLMRGFQLWVNLPAKDKMCAPRYQDIDPARVPEVLVAGAAGEAGATAAAAGAAPAGRSSVRVLAGRFGEVEGPVNAVATEPLYLDVAIEPGARFAAAVPAGHQAFAYVYEGGALLGARRVPVARGELAVLSGGERFEATAVEASRLVLVAGRPLREPVVRYGPFVMNTRDEIVRAIEDFNAGRF
jgi:redox-sensitive bicupin YhaK (pirin superfamily)